MPSVSAYRAGALLARNAPRPLVHMAARAAGMSAALASRDKRLLVARNLERAIGRPMGPLESRRRVAATFEWYARYYIESFALPSIDPRTIDSEFGYEGVGEIQAAVDSGIGPILVLPHLGSWEWAGWWLSLVAGFRVTVVVEPIEPPELFDWFVELRQSIGMNVVPLGPDVTSEVARAIKRGDVVCLLSDRDIGGGGVPVDFFGERTRLPAGPAMLSLRTGARLIPAAVYWRDGCRYGLARPPLEVARQGRFRDDVARLVQAYADELEYLIKLAPEQWHLMSPNWPSDYQALGEAVPESLQDLP
jgi:KDO2-lipid IV(A) lauroyltransferase